ncbi:hypothetical protein HBH70_201750 [Parastagonospora nodorum]|nr:hypothetical protein HBH52_009910 [Parastagonospora nodorum]KAH4025496.1 hypothetical protein HBI09_154200 [Parastagonospora nodorum]KAH4059700.1 hypothetical protein HBH49_021640 [Parastagonospora nodorum]KAH4075148.1 hypothetical protein HBH50_034490 [Parastagonospora nodorum]KAH4097207.1 hypothetical protein HBH48_043360 [Parastagonospora nodorum]
MLVIKQGKLPHLILERLGMSALPTTDLEVPSPLIRFPGELRNKIYQYVFTASVPLHHRQTWAVVSSRNLTFSRHHSFEDETGGCELLPRPFFNSLKFVCRQLYAEAAGLEYYRVEL